MTPLLALAHLGALLLLPFPVVGLINRTRSLWAGRKGPRLLQSALDLRRLLRKRPVYSRTTTILFAAGPLVVLATTLVAGLLTPLLGRFAPLAFPYDFVAFAYLWGLGRIFLMLAALDTGSAFEGMGASREATYAAFVEPALFLAFGTLAAATGRTTFAEILDVGFRSPAQVVTSLGVLFTLLVLLQVETARVPVDDPATHLELTMIHEVMILDHSGPDLAALQYAAAIKLTVCAGLIAGLLNPLRFADGPLLAVAVQLGLVAAVAVAVGFVESLVARLKLAVVPQYVLAGGISAALALLATAWAQGGGR
ncbi:MAG: NADH-quinone oxidoreductase subunit H [Anaeromyxobacter sp.]|nr:NADH-quinone oxidoreductase subunit H [Anaeromyxobacter sp.]